MSIRKNSIVLMLMVFLSFSALVEAKKDKKKEKAAEVDQYAEYVWPKPPDQPRIKLVDVMSGRGDVEGTSSFRKALIGVSNTSPLDSLMKPHAVVIDSQMRLWVTDPGQGSLVRFDRKERRYDVFGTRGAYTLAKPMGVGIGPDDTVYVADVARQRIMAFSADGEMTAFFGRSGDLEGPTDAEPSPDGSLLFVADSRGHRIVVFDVETGEKKFAFGTRGNKEGEFNYPSSLAFGPDGQLLVVDQANARVQLFTAEGEFLDQFGERGTGFGYFSRPKGVAVDNQGLIYVTDFAFNNVQIFDIDFELLTFVGEMGGEPGTFIGVSGVAARGDDFAIVDQIGHRVQLFRFIESRGGE